jgi:prepilin-type N-terminal cleavage/methylation domain-containing protein
MWAGFIMHLRRQEGGFTLIELLIAVVIIGVISVPLGNVVIGFFRNTDATSDRMALSHDAQISAAYFAQDVATVGMRDYTGTPDANGNLAFLPSIQLNAAYNAGAKSCGTSATPTAIVRFLSDDWDTSVNPAAVSTDIVAYYLTSVVTPSELHRIKCIGSSTTPASDVTLAHNVDPATVQVTCASPTTCDSASVPQQVTLAFSVTKPSVSAYPITLNGQRRQT